MEQAMLQMLIILVLGLHYRCALGFPVYDFDPSSLQEALKASVAKVNSQSLSPYLFQVTRSSLKRVNVLDEDTLVMNLEFSVQETTCPRESADPSSCTLQRGYYVPTASCRSTVQMSKEEVQDVWAHCRWASTSESNSSEEMTFGDMARSYRRRNDYLLGKPRARYWGKAEIPERQRNRPQPPLTQPAPQACLPNPPTPRSSVLSQKGKWQAKGKHPASSSLIYRSLPS